MHFLSNAYYTNYDQFVFLCIRKGTWWSPRNDAQFRKKTVHQKPEIVNGNVKRSVSITEAQHAIPLTILSHWTVKLSKPAM